MELIAADDPVYVVDLTEPALAACRADFALDKEKGTEHSEEGTEHQETEHQTEPPERPIRAVAFLLDDHSEPVLVPVTPTRDVEALDAMARLVRAAVVTEVPVSQLAVEFGDTRLRVLYEGRRLPAFLYGSPPTGLPRWLAELLR